MPTLPGCSNIRKLKFPNFSYFEMPRPSEFHTSIKTLMPTAITLFRVPNAQVSTFPKFHHMYGIVNSKPCRSAVSSCGLLGLVWHRPAMSHMLCRFDKECTGPACRTVSVGSSGLLGQAAKECIAESTGGTVFCRFDGRPGLPTGGPMVRPPGRPGLDRHWVFISCTLW